MNGNWPKMGRPHRAQYDSIQLCGMMHTQMFHLNPALIAMCPLDLTAKLCDPVVNMSHVNISTFDNWYPTEVNYTCQTGYFFPDGSLSRVSTCNKYGKWSEVIPQCIGEHRPIHVVTDLHYLVPGNLGTGSCIHLDTPILHK